MSVEQEFFEVPTGTDRPQIPPICRDETEDTGVGGGNDGGCEGDWKWC